VFVRALILFRAGLAVIGGLLLVVTFTPVVKWAASSLQQDWYDGDAGALIVLGGSMLLPGTGPDATMGQDTYLRCVYAAWACTSHHYKYVVVTGSEGLAQAMAHFLVDHGVPADKILQETAATSTSENAAFSKKILNQVYAESRLPPIVVLTSDYHSWRALRTFRRAGFQAYVIAVPDVIKRSSQFSYRWAGFITLVNESGKIAYYCLSGKL